MLHPQCVTYINFFNGVKVEIMADSRLRVQLLVRILCMKMSKVRIRMLAMETVKAEFDIYFKARTYSIMGSSLRDLQEKRVIERSKF